MPNLTPLPFPTVLLMVRADPIAPDRTRLFCRIYGLTDDIEEQESHLQNLEITNTEDTDMVTILMENLRSPFYRVGPPSAWEQRARSEEHTSELQSLMSISYAVICLKKKKQTST